MRPAAAAARLGIALAVTASLAACSGSTDFTVSKDFSVASTGGVVYQYVEAVDLAAEAPDAWKHRSKIKKLELVGLDATIQQLFSPATTGGGSIVLRPDGGTGATDVVVGTWPATEPVMAPHSLSVTLSPSAVGVIENALRGNGRFSVLLTGTTVDSASFLANVSLHIKLTYKVP
jgi:hypothetical protein